MKRRLVWTCGGLVAVGAVALAFLWPDHAPHGEDPTRAGASVLAVPSTRAAPSSPPAEQAAPAEAFGVKDLAERVGSSATNLVPPSATGAAASAGERAELAGATAEASEKRRAEHERVVKEHRKEVVEHAEKKQEEIARRQAERGAERAGWEAMRPPDPNRPPPEVTKLDLGPALLPEPQKNP